MKGNYDVSYYSTIGKKGGKAVLERYSVTYFSDIAKKKRKKGNKRKKEREAGIRIEGSVVVLVVPNSSKGIKFCQ